MAALGAIASTGTSIVGAIEAAKQQQQAQQYQLDALNAIQGVNTPEAQQLMVALQQYQNAGQLSPQMESAISQNPSAMANIQTDPRLMNAAMQSLQTLQKTGSGALQPQDLAALQQVKNASNNQARAQQQSILQNMQARGMGGSGAELAAQLSNGQNAANRANDQDLNIGAQASQRALQAMSQAGSLGASLQNQSFGQQAQQASAQDAINRYNAMNSQGVGNANTSAQNYAQQYNLNNAQNIANMNTGVANNQAMQNVGATQQAYQDQLGKTQLATGQGNALASTLTGQAGNTQSMYSGVGQGLGQAINAYQGNQAKTSANSGSPPPTTDSMGDNGVSDNASWYSS